MKIIKDGTITNVKGIKAAGISAQLKKSGKKDLALIYSEKKAVSAAVFTKNLVKAAPIILNMENIKNTFLKKKKTDYLISVNTKMILSLTVFILFISFALFYLLEHRNTMKEMSLGTQYLASLFQAITLRTAGFSTVSFLNLTNATLLFMIFIMFMGGAAGSTAGGIKLNTIAVVFAFFKSFSKVVLYRSSRFLVCI